MVKSLIIPGFLVFFTNIVKNMMKIAHNENEKNNKNNHFNENQQKNHIILMESFLNDSQKLYINKRFSDVSYVIL